MEGEVRMRLPVLLTFYYLDHFSEMLSFVESTYREVLGDPHRAFIQDFRSLTADEQCLLVRMINRRGYIFNLSRLKYDEIRDASAALSGLQRGGFLRALRGQDYAAWLSILRKDDLIAIAREAGCEEFRQSWNKPRLLDHIVSRICFEDAAMHGQATQFVAVANTEPLAFLLYLYFGKTHEDLKTFALRDLGIIRVNDAAQFKARFGDASEARACFYYSQLIDRLDVPALALMSTAAEDLLNGPLDGGDYARALRDRAAYSIGQYYERQKDTQRAIDIYRLAPSPGCNERLVRLLYAAGIKDEAKSIVEGMIDDPGSDDEYTFASDFYARKFDGRRVGACTELFLRAREVIVDENHRGNPEAGVAGVLRREQSKVYFTENLLWHNLFGLLFWEELFESGQLHSGFDWVPHCLKDRSFARLFEKEIGTKLTAVRKGAGLTLILKSVAAHWGRPNGIFSWDCIDVDALRDLLTIGNSRAVASVLDLMCRDFRAMRDGFPDLMVVKNGALGFVEVKAQGDAIRRNQLTRLRQLQHAGFDSQIIRADYRFDPEQIYAVVDIETTGGWGNSDRIIEIGAVKIRNHEVIDHWHSLINPQRSITASITQLTGITNAMVQDAPAFSDVADQLLAFIEDSIFVAHNVNFDYGFLAQEFNRIERRFRFPKFCTCAGMRRHFPGHRSYSLGRLCSLYEIALEHHHRALYDAEAAAKLLNLINKKRSGVTENTALMTA
jgi:DNA polymerase-3 subunit epsilon